MKDELKRQAARAALDFVEPGMVVGVGTGSTTNCFIDALPAVRERVAGVVSSSRASTERLAALGFRVLDANAVDVLPLYVDGADECNRRLELIKGGGGALTGEKIVAAMSATFVCIVDESKVVETLGAYPLPLDVIPMAAGVVGRAVIQRGGRPVLREGFVTDGGNAILDVHGLAISDAVGLERDLNNVPGIVTNGIFALRPADVVLVGRPAGVERLDRQLVLDRR
jgi:ribose 5-phosphate isomerase A